MKIISKFKDFYDYKVAEYGLDETLIFDRRDAVLVDENALKTKGIFQNPTEEDAIHYVLYVGNQLVHIFGTDNQVYTHFDFENPSDLGYHYDYFYGEDKIIKLKNGKNISIESFFYPDSLGQNFSLKEMMEKDRKENIFGFKFSVTPAGERLYWEDFSEKPLILLRKTGRGETVLLDANPPLLQMGLYIDPDFVWQNIVQFLSDLKTQAEKSPEVPNEDKIINKGFDKKTSFRPKMKRK